MAGAAAALAITLPFLPAVATTTTTELTAQLNGANEVPPADPNGTGEALVFAAAGNPDKLCFVLIVDQIGRPTWRTSTGAQQEWSVRSGCRSGPRPTGTPLAA